ncbi:MAG: GNAT family N-acetyltransferase [Oscillochloridaceae bacterium umkhey_bin13]
MELHIKAAQITDAERLVQIQIAAFHHDAVLYPDVGLGGPPGYDSVEQLRQTIAQHPCYKLLYDDQVIGVMVIIVKGEQHTHLDLIAIDPHYHNRGLGTLAMQFLEQAHPARCYTLDTPSWAVRNQHFYQKLGYVKVSATTYADITFRNDNAGAAAPYYEPFSLPA